MAQRLPLWCVCMGFVWWTATRLGAVVDVSRREAQRDALTVLEHQLQSAQQQIGGLTELRKRASQLGAGDAPEAPPDNGALLQMVSGAIKQSGASLDLFEPGSASLTMVVDGRTLVSATTLHMQAVGSYTQLLAFTAALAGLSQPFILDEAQLERDRSGRLVLDAEVRVIGAPESQHQQSKTNQTLPAALLADVVDPFAARPGVVPPPVGNHALAQTALGTFAGSFALPQRRALLVHQPDGWALLPVPLVPERRDSEAAMSGVPARATRIDRQVSQPTAQPVGRHHRAAAHPVRSKPIERRR